MSDMSVGTLVYQGRKASRHRSENRRVEILRATLKILVKDGVRAVRHRAVAKEADVPLSATTYYFKDITDLINDAFTFYAESSIQELTNLNGVETKSLIDSYKIKLSMQLDGENADGLMEKLVHDVTWIMVRYLKDKLVNNRYHLLLKQAFMFESTNNERLWGVGQTYYGCLQDLMEKMCASMGMDEPRNCAKLILGGIWAIEQDALRVPVEQFDDKAAWALLNRLVLPLTK